MPVPHIFAGTAGGTTAQFDANNAYLAARADNLNSLAGGGVGIGTSTAVAGRRLIVAGGAVRLDADAQLEWGGATVGCYANGGSNTFTVFTNTTARTAQTDTAFRPAADNALDLGGASFRWSVVRAVTGTINTSDGREKTSVRAMAAAEIAASRDLARELGVFQFLAAVAEKGADGARLHIGMTVQRAIQIMESHGLQPLRYAFICYDEWPESVVPARTEQRETGLFDAQGNAVLQTVEIAPAQTIPAGNRYGFRTDELLLFIARGLEARITALEAA